MAAGDGYFEIRRRHPRPDVLLVTATGEVDILTIGTLTDALDANLPATTVLDLSEVTLLSAVGLRALQEAVDRAEMERRQLRLVAANSCVIHLLRLTELDLRVPVFQSLPAALRG
jgi:anti-anti-sigma factor